MVNILDLLFASGHDPVPYALTVTDHSPSSKQPSVLFSTGELVRSREPGSIHQFLDPVRYRDARYKQWRGEGVRLQPSAMADDAWPQQLILGRAPSGYYIQLADRRASNAQATLWPEIRTGTRFPGSPDLSTAILTVTTWTGILVLVLGLPDGYAEAAGAR